MKRKEVIFCPEDFPEDFHPLLSSCKLFDSSCSKEARVWMLDGNERFFLKSAAAGTLKTRRT